MALLELVNSFRHLLRDAPVTTVAGANPDLQVQVDLINRAGRKLAARRAWSFLHRDDGYLYFPARVEGTGTFVNATTTADLNLTAAQASSFSSEGRVSKIVVTEDSVFPDTTYRIVNLETAGSTTATLPTTYRGDAGSLDYTIFSNEVRLPQSVAQLLYVRNEEGTYLRFETVDTFDDFDRRFPRESQRFGSYAEVVAVGGQVVPTTQNSGSITRGIGLKFWPPNTQDLMFRYGYVRQMDVLENDADEFVGVPQDVQDLIVSMAFEEALMGNIEDDPRRAATLRVSNELSERALVTSDQRDVGRRHIPQPYRQMGWWPYRYVTRDSIPEP